MDVYGRPQRKQSNPPSVEFLNETYKQKSGSVGSGFVASTNPKDVLRFSNNNLHHAATTSTAATITPLFAQQQHQAKSHSFRLVPRPQSGGIRRPSAADIAATKEIFSSSSSSSATVPPSVTKQRPSTAKLSSYPSFSMAPQAFMSTKGSNNTTKSKEEIEDNVENIEDVDLEEHGIILSGPETKDHKQKTFSLETQQEHLFIQKLKEDILYLTQLSNSSNIEKEFLGSPSSPAITHVKQLLHLRDEKTLDMQTKLSRYNPSNDPAQSVHIIMKLQEILGECLSKLMEKHLTFGSGQTGRSSRTGTTTGTTPTIDTTQKWKGTSSICYTSAFVSMLERTSKLETKLVASNMEKKELEEQMVKKNQELKRLQEDLFVFKDALAAAGKPQSSSMYGGNPEAQAQWHATLMLLQKQKKAEMEQQANKLKLDTRVEELTEELTQLKTVLEKTQLELQNFNRIQKEKSQLETTVNSLQLETQKLEQELLLSRTKEEENQRQMDQMMRQHTENLAISTQQASNLTREMVKIRGQLAQATQQLDTLKRTSAEEKALLRRSLEQEFETKWKRQEETWHQETQRQVMQVTEALQIKQQELSKTQKELCKIQENLSKTHHELTKALEDLSRSQKILPQTQDQLSKTQQQLAWAQQELSKTQLELTRVRLELRNIEEECLKLKQENTITHQQLTSIQQEDQQKLTITQQELTTTLLDLNRFQHENTVLLKRLEKIQNEFDLCQSQKNTLNCDLAIANAAVEGKDLLLTQSEDKLIRLQEEKNRLCNQIVHLENQMQLLEFKLTTMNQKEVEQKDWHEKVSTLQHDLSFQQAKTIALKEEQTKAIANAQEKVDHAEKCMKSMQEELQTANLCLFERKRQLELLLQEKNNLQDNNQRLTFELNQLTLQQEQKQMDLKNAMLQLKEDKQLIQQIVCTLAKRMKLQMDMVHILPPEFKNRTGSSSIKNVPDRTINILKRPSTAGTTRLTTMSTIGTPTGINIINNTSTGSGTTMLSVAGTLDDFICRFQTEQSNEWRKMQEKWAILQQEVDDIDWKLVHLRNRLEEMVLEESGSTTTPTTSTTTCGGVLSLELSSVTPGKNHHTFVNVSASPYSDAIKIGKSTLEIANESLKQPISRQNQLLNPSSSRPSTHAQDISDHNDVGNTKEETESFTVALKKEMKTMRESYENKLEELNTEVKKTQKLRMDSTQRLRTELEEEKMKNHQVITQLNEQLSVLEQKIQQLQNKTQQVQDQEMEVLEKYTEAIDDKTRRHVIKELFELIMNSCKDEFALRTARRQERVQKLHAYCGTSSVERK